MPEVWFFGVKLKTGDVVSNNVKPVFGETSSLLEGGFSAGATGAKSAPVSDRGKIRKNW